MVLSLTRAGFGKMEPPLHHAMADGHDACVGELRAELVEEAEHALQTLLMVVNRLFELMLLAVVLVLVMTVNRLADLLDQTGSDTLRRFQDQPADT